MEIKSLLALLLIIITYIGLTLGYLPYFRMNRAGLTMVSVSLLLLLGVVDFQVAWKAIDIKTLVFLFSIMILNAHLGYAGFFSYIMKFCFSYVKSPLFLLITITFSSGLLSAFFLNDTMALMLTPLIYGVTRSLNLNPKPYLLSLMLAVNTGSLMTPTGNPQNMIIATLSKLTFLDFLKVLWFPSLLGLILQIIAILILYPETRSLKTLPALDMAFRLHRGLLRKGLLISLGLFLAFILGYPMAEASFIAAGLILMTRRLRTERYFAKVDWELLVMFTGLFILTFVSQKLEVAKWLIPFTEKPVGLLFSALILSLSISNVPAVLLLATHVSKPEMWLLLAGSSTLAGNLTLIASVANLIVAELSEKEGYKITFWEHLKIGLPVTAFTLFLLYAWIVLLFF